MKSKDISIPLPPPPRFNHFAALCELLPVAVPSLICCARALFGDGSFGQAELEECSFVLGVDPPISDLDQAPFSSASFPGWRLCAAVRRHAAFGLRAEALLRGEQVQGRH